MADGLIGLTDGVQLRDAEAADRDFLLRVYGSTREAELQLTGWSEAEKQAFVESQFAAQDQSYRGQYGDGRFMVVLVDGALAGRLYLVRLPAELRVVDITLMPEYRGRGIGTALMNAVIAQADREAVAVTLHVEQWNPASRLYLRMGFEAVETHGIYEFMRRPAQGQLNTAS